MIDAAFVNPLYANWYGPGHLLIGCDEGGSARYVMSGDDTVQIWLAGCEWTEGAPVDGYISVPDGGSGYASATLALPFAELSLDEGGTISGVFRGHPVG